MKHWKYFAVVAVLVVLITSSCVTRAEPKVHEPSRVGEGIYTVRISSYYTNNFWGQYNEEVAKYAINQFVKSMGYESYDMELIRKPGWNRVNAEYTVTIPGSIPVEDLPEMTVKVYERW